MNASPNVQFSRTTASVLLDLVRGLAALVVCFFHWRRFLFVDYQQIEQHRSLFAVPYLLTGAGHKAVIVFFVLSGYLIAGSIFRLFEREGWSWRMYLTHRLVRLWIVLLPALALGAAFDFAGLYLRLVPALYAGKIVHIIPDVHGTFHLSSFFGNLFFLQGIMAPVFGSNGALWSLANEFWYYILFPCVFLTFRRGTTLWFRILNAICFLGCAVFVGKHILLLFPIWLLGAFLAAIPPLRSNAVVRLCTSIVYLLAFFFPIKSALVTQNVSDYFIGVETFVLLWILLGAGSEAPEKLWGRASRVLARFSYTLYLVHMPLLLFVTALVTGGHLWQPDVRHVLLGLAILLVTIGYAYAVASLTEFKTDTVRRWVEIRVLGKAISPKLPVAAK